MSDRVAPSAAPSLRLACFLAAICTFLVLVTGCGTAPPVASGNVYGDSAETGAPTGANLRKRAPGEVAPGFDIKLSCLEDQNLNGKFRVDFAGELKLPYNVMLNTDGLTIEALRNKLVESYAKYFKSSPKLGVSVAEERYWIDIRGLVEKPGRFLVHRSTSLDEALSLAGGLQKTASVKFVKIQQGEGAVTVKLSDYYAGTPQDRLPPWQGGDVLFFQSDRDYSDASVANEKAYVQFLGEVKTPGEYRYLKKADFYDYLFRAGGPTEKANLLKIELVRTTPEGRSSSTFELGDPKDVPSLQPGDLVLVHADKQTPSERVIAMTAGIAGILNTLLLIILLF